MRALLLTCDRYRPLTEHMLRCYQRAWPECPFEWCIPFQDRSPFTSHQSRIVPIPTPAPIRATVLALLAGIPDDEWIFWALDDKYPIALDVPWLTHFLSTLHDLPSTVGGACFTSSPRAAPTATLPALAPGLFACSEAYLFWVPQFLRAGTLRRIFTVFPTAIARAGWMDALILRYSARTPISALPSPRCATAAGHAVWGESTIRGQITAACAASCASMGIDSSTFPLSADQRPMQIGSDFLNPKS